MMRRSICIFCGCPANIASLLCSFCGQICCYHHYIDAGLDENPDDDDNPITLALTKPEKAVKLLSGERGNSWICLACGSKKINCDKVEFNPHTGFLLDADIDGEYTYFYEYFKGLQKEIRAMFMAIMYPEQYWYLWNTGFKPMSWPEQIKYNKEHENDSVDHEEYMEKSKLYKQKLKELNASLYNVESMYLHCFLCICIVFEKYVALIKVMMSMRMIH